MSANAYRLSTLLWHASCEKQVVFGFLYLPRSSVISCNLNTVKMSSDLDDFNYLLKYSASVLLWIFYV